MSSTFVSVADDPLDTSYSAVAAGMNALQLAVQNALSMSASTSNDEAKDASVTLVSTDSTPTVQYTISAQISVAIQTDWAILPELLTLNNVQLYAAVDGSSDGSRKPNAEIKFPIHS